MMRFAFKLYDIDGDDKISERDLYNVFVGMPEQVFSSVLFKISLN